MSPEVTVYTELGDLAQAFDRPRRNASLEDLSDCDTHWVGCPVKVRAGALGSALPLPPSPPLRRDPGALVMGLPVWVVDIAYN